MMDLDPEARRILDLARAARTPSEQDKARFERRLATGLGLSIAASASVAAAEATKGLGVSKASGMRSKTAMKTPRASENGTWRRYSESVVTAPQISEITKVVSLDTYERPIYAGNAVATIVPSSDDITIASCSPMKTITACRGTRAGAVVTANCRRCRRVHGRGATPRIRRGRGR